MTKKNEIRNLSKRLHKDGIEFILSKKIAKIVVSNSSINDIIKEFNKMNIKYDVHYDYENKSTYVKNICSLYVSNLEIATNDLSFGYGY